MARAQLTHASGQITVSEAAERVRESYQNIRLTKVIHGELEPRGLDLNQYYERHQTLSPHIVQMIDQALSSSDLGVTMLIAGANEQVHAIYTILNSGAILDNGGIGHGAIGTGAPHALSVLIEGAYTSSMTKDQVTELVEKAKLRSEVAPGVGTQATIVAIPTTEDTSDAQSGQEEATQDQVG